MAKVDIQILARLGAEARLRQLDEERAALLAAFPGLGRAPRVAAGRRPRRKAAAQAKKRRKMTAAQKKAVSVRMKKYWAERRKAKK